MQKNEIIVGHEIPVWIDINGEKWYGISAINTKILMRQNKNNKSLEKYSNNMKKIKLNFGNQNVETNCINLIGIKMWIENLRIGSMTKEQRHSTSMFCEYLDIPIKINIGEFIINKKDFNLKNYYYTNYELECIKSNDSELYKMCSICQRYFPMNLTFFSRHDKSNDGFNTVCKQCRDINIKHSDENINIIFNKFGADNIDEFLNSKSIIEYMIDKNIYLVTEDSKENELLFIAHCIKNNKIKEITLVPILLKKSINYEYLEFKDF